MAGPFVVATADKELVHRPVMLREVIEALMVKPDGFYVDATFGRGGHAAAMVARLDARGRLLVIDKDPQAVAVARDLFGADERVILRQGSFADMPRFVEACGRIGRVDGVLLDLGVSSPQLDDPARGFSFRGDGPLDMRMDPGAGVSAAQWLATVSEAELTAVLFEYGEERFAKRIARTILHVREASPILTTGQLAAIVARAVPTRERGKDPATRTFQAIRIAINNELDDLKACLAQLPNMLASGGRMVVISFHSLEDRIVKHFIRNAEQGPRLPRGLPVRGGPAPGVVRRIGKAQHATEEEVAANPRARSAVLRVAERV